MRAYPAAFHAFRPSARHRSSLLLLGVLAMACDGNKEGSDSSDNIGGVDSGSGGGEEGGDEGSGSGDDPPEISSGRSWCTAGSDSSGDLLFFTIKVSDAQGSSNLNHWGTLRASDSEGEEDFEADIFVCTGLNCEASFRDGDYGSVTCATGGDFTYEAMISDVDGNDSGWVELEWEGLKE